MGELINIEPIIRAHKELAELEAGTLTRSPLDLLSESIELLKPLEQFLDDEALAL